PGFCYSLSTSMCCRVAFPTPPIHHPCVFFFLMIRPPPTSPLFPYTTLFRSQRPPHDSPPPHGSAGSGYWGTRRRLSAIRSRPVRSEEHTSELQSLTNLVCRLLLEKKKTTHKRLTTRPLHRDLSRHHATTDDR